MLSRSKARLCIRSAVWCTASVHVLDYKFLINQATKTLLRHALPTRLKKHHADEVEVEISWDTLVYYTQSLNQYCRYKGEKKSELAAQDAHLACQQSSNLKHNFQALRRTVQA